MNEQDLERLSDLTAEVFFGILSYLVNSLFLVVMWNNLITDMFGLREVNYIEAMILIYLCRILFVQRRKHYEGGK